MNKCIQVVLPGILLIIISACATTPLKTIPPEDAAQLVHQLDTDLAKARFNQVNVLAPGGFKDAQSAFVKAQRALDRGEAPSAIQKYVAEGNAHLRKAEQIAEISRKILTETNEAREKALRVGADRLNEPFMQVEKQYLRLTKAIENDDVSYAQDHAAQVQAAFHQVEIMAIKHNALGKARKLMADADKADVQAVAPTAYNDALQFLHEADTYIEKNPYAAEAINHQAADAEFLAQRAITIAKYSRKFKEMTPEETTLYVENLFSRLSKTMDAGDLRDKGFENQLATMSDVIGKLQQKNRTIERENQDYQSRIADLEQRLEGLQGYSREQEQAKRKLAAERDFNERFNKVQHYFRRDEADVYKQGNQLVIRLRGIRFPVGQAILTPDNYTLLSKVQQAIQAFDQPTVTIEGHTDSTGSPEKNLELSQQRADAVRTYLVANHTLPAYRILSAGYGPDRPLAPNTTPEGRAINRRIDVLIKPLKTP
jgi:OmpA-OmpF porin, OOP family